MFFNLRVTKKAREITKDLRGFTLIELLLVIGIIGLIAAGSGVVFKKFRTSQNLSVAYDNMQTALAEAKSNALSHVVIKCKDSSDAGPGDTPGVLVGYQVSFTANGTTYSLQEVCRPNSNPATTTNILVKTTNLPQGIQFSGSPSPVLFLVLSGGAQANTSITIGNSSSSQTKTINVSTSGVIQ